MKILLTGKTGQVGFHLARTLAKLGTVHATDREKLDLSDPDAIRDTIRDLRPDVIVNAGGYTHVDNAESEQSLAQSVNARAPGIMAEEARRIDALLVHYSSVYVFDGTKESPYGETDAPNPINAYGRSKLDGEKAIAAAGAEHLILRASWVYDVRGRNFLLTMLRLAGERDVLQVVEDQIGSPTWARAIAVATAAILSDFKRAREASGIYNLSALGSVTRYDFTQRVLEQTRRASPGAASPRLVKIKTPDFPLPAPRPLNSVLDNSKLASVFASALASWEEQLSACLAELAARVPEPSGR